MFLGCRDVTLDLVQPAFEAALRKRVGTARPMAAFELAADIGVAARTVENWLYEGKLPGLPLFLRLAAYLGPDFVNETLCIIGLAAQETGTVDAARSDALARLLKIAPALEEAAREIQSVNEGGKHEE